MILVRSLDVQFQNVNKTNGISMILECRIDVFNSKLEIASPSRTLNRAKSGSGAPGPKSALRDTKSTTFAKGFFQPSNLLKYLLKYLLNYILKYIL